MSVARQACDARRLLCVDARAGRAIRQSMSSIGKLHVTSPRETRREPTARASLLCLLAREPRRWAGRPRQCMAAFKPCLMRTDFCRCVTL